MDQTSDRMMERREAQQDRGDAAERGVYRGSELPAAADLLSVSAANWLDAEIGG